MFRKLNPLVLFAILVVLLIAVVLILRMDARKQQGSFLRELVSVDRQKTTSFVVIPKGMMEDAISLEKKEDRWVVGSQGKTYQANRELVDQIFWMLSPMVPEQLVSRNQEDWHELEVNESQGIRVKVYEGNRITGDFVIGKFNFQQQFVQGQQQPKISTYIRLTGSNDVYAVEGFLSASFPQSLDQYRDQAVMNVRTADIERISVEGNGEYDYELTRAGESWFINGTLADSASTAFYLDVISWVSSNGFVEEEAEGWLTIPSMKLTVERKNGAPVKVTAYPADPSHQYFITSSQNPGAVFSGTINDLFETIFHPQDYFSGQHKFN
jgi:hypothetical protein